jgi:hypothetical protein
MTWAGLPTRPRRPMPRDFPDTFARVGWDGIEAEMRAHKDTIRRWMIDYGQEELIRMRREYLEQKYAAEGRKIGGVRPGRKLSAASRYVLGMRRSTKPAPTFFDVALMEDGK